MVIESKCLVNKYLLGHGETIGHEGILTDSARFLFVYKLSIVIAPFLELVLYILLGGS